MNLLNPVTGLKRVWNGPEPVNVRQAAVPLNAAPPKPREQSNWAGMVTTPQIAEHSMGLILTPVSPDRARAILLAALQGDLWMQYDLFCRMEDSWDRLGKDLNEVKNAVKRLSWTVTPYTDGAKPATDSAEEKAELVRRALTNWQPEVGGLDYGFEDLIYNALDAFGKGISVQELHWDRSDGVWLPRSAHFLSPRSYGWAPNGARLGLLLGSETTTVRSGAWMPFVQDKFLVGTWSFRSGVPGATALLRPLVPYWIGMTYGWQWLMQLAQIFGIPFRWANYDSNHPGLKGEVGRMLANMGASGYAAFPDGTTLNFLEAVTNARDNPQAVIIEAAKEAVDLVILGQKLSGDSQPTGLGSGTALLHGQVRQEVLHGAANWMASLLGQQLVLPLLRINYGELSEMPIIAPDLSIDPDPKVLAERDQILLTSTDIQFPAKWFRERHGVPPAAPGEEVISGKAPAVANPNAEGQNPNDGLPDPKAEGGNPKGEGRNPKADVQAKAFVTAALEAKANDAMADRLVDHVLEELTGVEARWLGGVKPFFRQLLEAARSEDLTDTQFIAVLERAQKHMPELFHKLDHKALADAMEAAMGAACVNGAVQGWMKRKA